MNCTIIVILILVIILVNCYVIIVIMGKRNREMFTSPLSLLPSACVDRRYCSNNLSEPSPYGPESHIDMIDGDNVVGLERTQWEYSIKPFPPVEMMRSKKMSWNSKALGPWVPGRIESDGSSTPEIVSILHTIGANRELGRMDRFTIKGMWENNDARIWRALFCFSHHHREKPNGMGECFDAFIFQDHAWGGDKFVRIPKSLGRFKVLYIRKVGEIPEDAMM